MSILFNQPLIGRASNHIAYHTDNTSMSSPVNKSSENHCIDGFDCLPSVGCRRSCFLHAVSCSSELPSSAKTALKIGKAHHVSIDLIDPVDPIN